MPVVQIAYTSPRFSALRQSLPRRKYLVFFSLLSLFLVGAMLSSGRIVRAQGESPEIVRLTDLHLSPKTVQITYPNDSLPCVCSR